MMDNCNNTIITGGTFTVTNFAHGQTGPLPGMDVLGLLKDGVASGAFHNASERYDPPKCHPQTRLEVLDAIMDWIKDGQKTSFLMWLYGPAGAGKSAIAQTIAEMCSQAGILGASFFWSRNATGRNDENRLIATLAYQLVVAIPQMAIHVKRGIESDPLILSRTLEAQMESLIVQPLEKTFPTGQERAVDPNTPKLMILDGLDECGDPSVQAYILKVIAAAIQKFPINICIVIASRPEQEIRDSFNIQPLLSITARLALDVTYHPDDDIRIFLADSFNSIRQSHVLHSLLPATWPTTEDLDTLVRKSSGQFIYAATVVKFVRNPRRRPDEQLKITLGISAAGKQTPFAELDALYLHVFGTVEDLPRAMEIMSCLFFLDSKLLVNDVEDFLSYARGDLYLILSDLHSVLDVPANNNPLHVFHASLQDFLMDQNRSQTYFLDESMARARLTQCFIRQIGYFPSSKLIVVRGYFGLAKGLLESKEFVTNCLKSSPTRDLLRDFLSFDLEKWVSVILSQDIDLEPLELFEQVIRLSEWFQTQESNFKEYFGSGISLYDCHAHERDKAIGILMKKTTLDWVSYFDTDDGQDKITAVTHPLLLDGQNRSTMYHVLKKGLEGGLGRHPAKPEDIAMPSEWISELQQFLCDSNRAGFCDVDGRMYAAFSLRIAQFIFEPIRNNRYYKIGLLQLGEQTLQLAFATLPFYLSKADYISELANFFLNHTFDPYLLKEFPLDIQPVQDAIDLYLKKDPYVKTQPQVESSELRRKRRRRK